MPYVENNYYPSWLPEDIRGFVDLSELVEPNKQIIEEANILIEILGANIAVYKGSNHIHKGSKNGLCSLFKSAVLQNEQLNILCEAERRLKDYVIIAYSNPLEPHDKIDLLDIETELNTIREVYDTVAKEWTNAFANEHDNKPKDIELLHRFAKEVGDKTPIWDFGCGPGNTTKYLSDLGVIISGLDLSEKIIEQAKTVYPEINFQRGNFLSLDFKSDSIAGIVAFYAVVHFTKKQIKKAFQEIFRVLKPGGLFLFTYHVGDKTIHFDEFLGKKVDIDFMFFTNEFIMDCLKNIGFNKIELIEREPYKGIEYESKRAYVFANK